MSETRPLDEERLTKLRARNARALGRALSLLESRAPGRRALLQELHPAAEASASRRVGITGPPGAGKSTLVSQLVSSLREAGQTVAILAVDPTSPFSGGALLGDRVRMQQHYNDPDVFIRSMATRGHLGGLASATVEAVELLAAVGFDWVVVETVGVGQDEVEIIQTVDTVAVVVVPGLGDEIQAIKAGVMEIADLFVVNKSDLEGAQRTRRHLEMLLDMDPPDQRRPEILETVAHRGEGIEALRDALDRHRTWLEEGDQLRTRRLEQRAAHVESLVVAEITGLLQQSPQSRSLRERLLDEGADPFDIASKLLEQLFSGSDSPARAEIAAGPIRTDNLHREKDA